MNIIDKINLWLDKQQKKVYLQPGEKPPKGVPVQRGKRGGVYYLFREKLNDKQAFEISSKE